MKSLNAIRMGGREVLPLIEGGKGISVSNGESSGAWAAAGGIGTFSGVNADSYDKNGKIIPIVYRGKTRRERHLELIDYAISGGIAQAKIAHDISGGQGLVHMNVLWEMAAAETILHGVLEGSPNLIHGVTCGAGMPYRIAEISAKYKVYYYPIVSSARAFRALWKRAFHNFPEYLGGVVYEDPWLAGGHNGLSNSEDPTKPETPYPRVAELRRTMNEFKLENIPIIMAGGVWYLREWQDWIENPELGQVGFQFGTRPLLTQESPISDRWKKRLLELKEGDVYLNHFSPTGFYSSAVTNPFLHELKERSERQIAFTPHPHGAHDNELKIGPRARSVFVTKNDLEAANRWMAAGFTEAMRTPESTMIFVTVEEGRQIRTDQIECMGCLSSCLFSNWSQHNDFSTGKPPDPRSFCIQKTLQAISHSDDIDHQLMFAGHNAYRFGTDPFYKDGFIPSVKQLFDRLVTGD